MADHPRIRGEHSRNCDSPRASVGSSPHTRGAPRRETFDRAKFGIIPAYAGSTCRRPPAWRTDRDHPRIRGEHDRSSGAAPVAPRIIPAYAGSTIRGVEALLPLEDHPRIRGEHALFLEGVPVDLGSSPHTRGAPGCRAAGDGEGGIIPAYAGSTLVVFDPPHLIKDHPRIRGEHCSHDTDGEAPTGSSPHTRGARRLRPHLELPGGDHPRIRGEHLAGHRSSFL